jgi:hypothetical protein
MEDTRKRYTCRLKDIEITITERKLYAGERYSEYVSAPRMYVDIKDETLVENLMNRHSRPYNLYKQRAGCSCPCSPGFILPKQTLNIGGNTFSHFDVWITFTSVPSPQLAAVS